MKTKSILAIGALTFTVVFTSCKKCEHCHYDDANGNEVEIGELCDDELKNAEANGYAIGDTTVTIHCEAH